MKTHTVKIKQENMLCHRCLLKAVNVLGEIPDIKQLILTGKITNIKDSIPM